MTTTNGEPTGNHTHIHQPSLNRQPTRPSRPQQIRSRHLSHAQRLLHGRRRQLLVQPHVIRHDVSLDRRSPQRRKPRQIPRRALGPVRSREQQLLLRPPISPPLRRSLLLIRTDAFGTKLHSRPRNYELVLYPRTASRELD